MRSSVFFRRLKPLLLSVAFLMLMLAGCLYWQMERMVPDLSGEYAIKGLDAPVQVKFDSLGIPQIQAGSRQDALRAMGYVTARERLFQMDLMRRKTGGRLAEVVGVKALPSDRFQRGLLTRQAAEKAVQFLPADQRQALQAYVDGINAYLADPRTVLPLEFRLLGYHPEPWTLTDSMLVALEMFQALNLRDEVERTLSIMNRTLPAEVTAFLTPDDDLWGSPMVGGSAAVRPTQPVPVKQLAELVSAAPTGLAKNDWMVFDAVTIGSNQWTVSGSRTRDGRAILANDMHLRLRIPNIWYRAHLAYGGREIGGVSLPGLPLFAAGGNGYLAWGFTNALADLVDLVSLREHPEEPDKYLTPDGYENYQQIREVIAVKGQQDEIITIRNTRWGPVMSQPLMGQPVALNWTALHGDAMDLSLLEMDNRQTLEEGLDLMSAAGLPAMNAMLADDKGHIGWTLTGRYPRRQGLDGTLSVDWSSGEARWNGYLSPRELPRLVDPPQGFLVTANNRTMGADYTHALGHNYASGYRAFRIAELLDQGHAMSETDLFRVQLDSTTRFFDFYQRVALEAIGNSDDALLLEARRALEAWDGRASRNSIGFGLLDSFRKNLIQHTLGPYMSACREADAGFTYRWLKADIPLRELLARKQPETLPEPGQGNWQQFIRSILKDTAQQISQAHSGIHLEQLAWGKENSLRLSHPFSRGQPLLAWLLDMPQEPLDGCRFCVRVVSRRYGATERLVLSPGRPQDGILHMPGGQSGNPFSPHYRDQQPYWQEGEPLPYAPGPEVGRLQLMPAS